MTIDTIGPNHIIVYTGNEIRFFSYDTLIVKIQNGQVYLSPKWKYSSTTSKYRNRFLDETTKETEAKLLNNVYKMLS